MSRLIRNQQLPQLLDNSLGHSELLKLLKMGNWTEYVVFNLKLCRTKLSSRSSSLKSPRGAAYLPFSYIYSKEHQTFLSFHSNLDILSHNRIREGHRRNLIHGCALKVCSLIGAATVKACWRNGQKFGEVPSCSEYRPLSMGLHICISAPCLYHNLVPT